MKYLLIFLFAVVRGAKVYNLNPTGLRCIQPDRESLFFDWFSRDDQYSYKINFNFEEASEETAPTLNSPYAEKIGLALSPDAYEFLLRFEGITTWVSLEQMLSNTSEVKILTDAFRISYNEPFKNFASVKFFQGTQVGRDGFHVSDRERGLNEPVFWVTHVVDQSCRHAAYLYTRFGDYSENMRLWKWSGGRFFTKVLEFGTYQPVESTPYAKFLIVGDVNNQVLMNSTLDNVAIFPNGQVQVENAWSVLTLGRLQQTPTKIPISGYDEYNYPVNCLKYAPPVANDEDK